VRNEWQPDEGQRHDDAERREGDLDPHRLQPGTDPAVAGIERRQRDAGDGGWQREGQIHNGIDDLLAGKAVAHQNPRDHQAEEGVDERRDQRRAEADPEGRQHARRRHRRPEAGPAQSGSRQDQARERDQHDQAEVAQSKTQRQPEAGQNAGFPQRPPPHAHLRSAFKGDIGHGHFPG